MDDLVQYRIDVAKEKLKSAKILLDAVQKSGRNDTCDYRLS